jgi:serine protease DegQ
VPRYGGRLRQIRQSSVVRIDRDQGSDQGRRDRLVLAYAARDNAKLPAKPQRCPGYRTVYCQVEKSNGADDEKDREMHSNLNGKHLATTDRRSKRIICRIIAMLFLHAFTAASWAQLPGPPVETSGSATLAPLIRKIIPSVVSITTKRHAPVKHIYVDPNSTQFPDAPYGSTDRETESAGVVVDGRDGLIVTSAHDIEEAYDISITLSDGRRFRGSLVDADSNTDVAVISVAAADLVALPMADSETLEVGDYLVAVGNPFGKGTAVSHGIVSALHRSGLHFEGYQDFIQTDAPLNPGNSGGPLVNLRGELVGIAAAITSPTGSNVGVGFGIPVNRVRYTVERAVRNDDARRARAGG